MFLQLIKGHVLIFFLMCFYKQSTTIIFSTLNFILIVLLLLVLLVRPPAEDHPPLLVFPALNRNLTLSLYSDYRDVVYLYVCLYSVEKTVVFLLAQHLHSQFYSTVQFTAYSYGKRYFLTIFYGYASVFVLRLVNSYLALTLNNTLLQFTQQ